MHQILWRGRFAVLGVAVAASVVFGVRWGRGDAVAEPDGEKSLYVGARFCARCHQGPRDFDDTDYVLLTEYKRWKEEDKHSQAYLVLSNERSRQMARILGWKVEEDARCLNCHAANVPPELRQNDFNIRDGVSCDACHGPASRWIVPHVEKKWRTLAPAAKKALGMHDVRDPVLLSRLCSSCHVGSVAECKVVTHDMYAAGHPPLPSVEIATFCDKMPPHWRYLSEKPAAVQQTIRAAFPSSKEERERARITILGAVVVFQASLDLLADPKANDDERWPELANYDCQACHHELKTPSWRQQRGYAGAPGRPPMHEWPSSLLEDAVRHANDPVLAKQGEERLRRLRQAFNTQPFGDRRAIARSAADAREWSQRLLQRLLDAPYDSPAVLRLARGTCAAKAESYDYQSARQKAWALDVFLSAARISPSGQLENKRAELRKELRLDLPSGTKKQILRELPDNLHSLNGYNPRSFQKILDELRPLIPRE